MCHVPISATVKFLVTSRWCLCLKHIIIILRSKHILNHTSKLNKALRFNVVLWSCVETWDLQNYDKHSCDIELWKQTYLNSNCSNNSVNCMHQHLQNLFSFFHVQSSTSLSMVSLVLQCRFVSAIGGFGFIRAWSLFCSPGNGTHKIQTHTKPGRLANNNLKGLTTAYDGTWGVTIYYHKSYPLPWFLRSSDILGKERCWLVFVLCQVWF